MFTKYNGFDAWEKIIQWVDPDFPQQKNPHSRWLNAIIALETHEHPLITLYK